MRKLKRHAGARLSDHQIAAGTASANALGSRHCSNTIADASEDALVTPVNAAKRARSHDVFLTR
jgi:hypothetical protein